MDWKGKEITHEKMDPLQMTPIEKKAAYDQAYRVAHREEIRVKENARYHAHRDERKAYSDSHREEIRANGRRARHGISQVEFDGLLDRQGGACAICHRVSWNGKGPQIDHDHKTGRIRGILCHGCNVALGHIQENPEIARAMIDYLSVDREFFTPATVSLRTYIRKLD